MKSEFIIFLQCLIGAMPERKCSNKAPENTRIMSWPISAIKEIVNDSALGLNLGEAITRFAHNVVPMQQEIPNCDTKDCYNLTLAYNITINQMKKVIENSDSCQQSFKVKFPLCVLFSIITTDLNVCIQHTYLVWLLFFCIIKKWCMDRQKWPKTIIFRWQWCEWERMGW